MELSPAYLEGIRLFNAGHYWHAHEQWEACWLASSPPHTNFYKGIIQTAAALVKWQQGNDRGLALNWAKSRAYLSSLPSPFLSLNVAKLVAAMDAFVSTEELQPPQLLLVDRELESHLYLP
jgi:hypothetical protein